DGEGGGAADRVVVVARIALGGADRARIGDIGPADRMAVALAADAGDAHAGGVRRGVVGAGVVGDHNRRVRRGDREVGRVADGVGAVERRVGGGGGRGRIGDSGDAKRMAVALAADAGE